MSGKVKKIMICE